MAISKEEILIKLSFFLTGFITTMPTDSIISLLYIFNHVYKDTVSVHITGCLSGFMIASSFFQLSSTFVSHNLLLACLFVNALNMALLLFFFSILHSPIVVILILVSVIGFLIGLIYSAGVKYSLLFPVKVNLFFSWGICFSALVNLLVNLVVSSIIIKQDDESTFRIATIICISLVIFFQLSSLIIIYLVRKNSPIFMNARHKIETFYKYSANEIKTEVEDEIKESVFIDMTKEKDEKEKNIKEDNFIKNSESNPNEKKKENEYLKNDGVNEEKQQKFTSQKINTKNNLTVLEKLQIIKKSFKFENVFLGAKIIKFYYLCFLPICYTVLISFATYPHTIPLSINIKAVLNTSFMLIFQVCDIFGNFCIIYFGKVRKILNQKIVFFLCLIRTALLPICFYVSRLNFSNKPYLFVIASVLLMMVGLTTGSLINISYARIPDYFKDHDDKEKKISAASSFSALMFIVSFSLAPWCYALLNKVFVM